MDGGDLHGLIEQHRREAKQTDRKSSDLILEHWGNMI